MVQAFEVTRGASNGGSRVVFNMGARVERAAI